VARRLAQQFSMPLTDDVACPLRARGEVHLQGQHGRRIRSCRIKPWFVDVIAGHAMTAMNPTLQRHPKGGSRPAYELREVIDGKSTTFTNPEGSGAPWIAYMAHALLIILACLFNPQVPRSEWFLEEFDPRRHLLLGRGSILSKMWRIEDRSFGIKGCTRTRALGRTDANAGGNWMNHGGTGSCL
jgi:hypothetical protein